MDGPPWLARSNHVCILSGDHAGGHDAGRQGRINDHSCVLASRRPWASGHVPTPCLGFRTFPFLIPLPLAVSIIMRSDFWTKKMNWVMSDLTSHFTPLCFCIDQVASFLNTFFGYSSCPFHPRHALGLSLATRFDRFIKNKCAGEEMIVPYRFRPWDLRLSKNNFIYHGYHSHYNIFPAVEGAPYIPVQLFVWLTSPLLTLVKGLT